MAGGTVVIVGAGQAGFQTAASLRDSGFGGKVLLVGDEPGLPYQRPPLSKSFLAGTSGLESLWFRPQTFYDKHDIELLAGERVMLVDRLAHSVRMASGATISYDSLVLATGSNPWMPDWPGRDLDGVVTLRTRQDADALSQRLKEARDVAVIGGGFIGLEAAATAGRLGAKITVVEALPGVMSRTVSAPAADFFADQHARWGTRLVMSAPVTRILGDKRGRVSGIELRDGQRLPADLALVAVGVRPNVELAQACGLAVDDGVLVDDHLRTQDPRVSAIGDCARYPSRFSDMPVRLESVQNAADQARCVAAQLAGDPQIYRAVPWFWTEQRDLKLQIAGITAGHDSAIVRRDEAKGTFSVFCFKRERLVGVESLNRASDHVAARRLLGLVDDGGSALSAEEANDPSLNFKTFVAERASLARSSGGNRQ
jgi:3-phenylpropionate/trans-cinnamate dioxygenase ferredoxin reductase subunit